MSSSKIYFIKKKEEKRRQERVGGILLVRAVKDITGIISRENDREEKIREGGETIPQRRESLPW